MDGYKCRLCLSTIFSENCCYLKQDSIVLNMLNIFIANLNLDTTRNPIICDYCRMTLENSYNLKDMLLRTEMHLNQIACNYMVDLKSLVKTENPQNNFICRICLKWFQNCNIYLYENENIAIPCDKVKEMCHVVFELDFVPCKNPVICTECWETLQIAFNFKEYILNVEKQMNSYCQINDVKMLSDSDLQQIKEHFDDQPNIFHESYDNKEILKSYIQKLPEFCDNFDSVTSYEFVQIKSEVKNDPDLLLDIKKEINSSEIEDSEYVNPELVTKIDIEESCKVEDSIVNNRNSTSKSNKSFAKKQTENPPKYFYCFQCHYKTTFKGELGRHMLVHQSADSVPLFLCPQCPFKTKRKKTLTHHMLVHSEPEIIFRCELCSYKAKRKGNLTQHVLLVHSSKSDTEKFECNHCKFKTNSRNTLRRHLQTHEPAKFKCSKCNYKARRQDSLDYHVLKHEARDSVPVYQCSNCSYKTIRKKYYTKHMLSHNQSQVETI